MAKENKVHPEKTTKNRKEPSKNEKKIKCKKKTNKRTKTKKKRTQRTKENIRTNIQYLRCKLTKRSKQKIKHHT